MSIQLLKHLNGPKRGLLYRWLEENPAEPRIAWYPSAGTDMRDLLFLHSDYSQMVPPTKPEPTPPEFFLHTDYFGGNHALLSDSVPIYQDSRTTIRVSEIEELPRLELPLHRYIVTNHEGSEATHRVLFMSVDVTCLRLGCFRRPVLYAFAENAAFCAERLIPLSARCSHLVQVRYGHGFGGGRASPGWLRHQIDRLGVEVLISDGAEQRDRETNAVFQRFPILDGPETRMDSWSRLRSIPQRSWDGYGGVSWWSRP